VRDYAARRFVAAEPLDDPRMMTLTLMVSAHGGRQRELVLRCPTAAARADWLRFLTNGTTDDANAQCGGEQRYEPWDCPRFVLLRDLKTGENDDDAELVLPPLNGGLWLEGRRGDLVDVLRATNQGKPLSIIH